LQDKVHLVGAQPQEAVVELYKQATLGVFPCIVAEDGNRDGLPTVLLEALACELPVVSTPITGIPEIVIDGVTGMLRPPGDAAALAEAIGQLFDDPALRAKLGRQGRVHCKREFDIQMNGARLRSWFQERLAAQPVPEFAGASQEI
jgi:glycosyltransferase involved in cell wall biosynthesis